MNDDVRTRLRRTAATLEMLRERNDAQRAKLTEGASHMGDAATAFVESVRERVAAGDPAATAAAGQALAGRYLARQIEGGPV